MASMSTSLFCIRINSWRSLDIYGKEKIQPVKEKVEKAYKEYRKCEKELQAFNMDEEQRNREFAFLEFEVREIEKAVLREGEDEELEKTYRKLSNGRKIVDALQAVRGFTGYEGSSAGDLVGEALRELSRVSEDDEELAGLESSLGEVDSLLNDFNRELSSYMEDMVFDQETFEQTEPQTGSDQWAESKIWSKHRKDPGISEAANGKTGKNTTI